MFATFSFRFIFIIIIILRRKELAKIHILLLNFQLPGIKNVSETYLCSKVMQECAMLHATHSAVYRFTVFFFCVFIFKCRTYLRTDFTVHAHTMHGQRRTYVYTYECMIHAQRTERQTLYSIFIYQQQRQKNRNLWHLLATFLPCKSAHDYYAECENQYF